MYSINCMLEFLLGILAGVFTGILPAIHINTVAFIISAAKPEIGFLDLASFIVGLSISHNFFDFIPSIVFGSGEEGTALSSFAGNKMFLEGKGLYALKLLSLGAILGAIFFMISLPVLFAFLPMLFSISSEIAWAGLLAITLHLILNDSSPKNAVIVFVASGMLGIFFLDVISLNSPLLSLFSGLFGLGILWSNLSAGNVLKQENVYGIGIEKPETLKTGVAGIASSLALGLVPSIGPTQAGVLLYKGNSESFLVKLGLINIADVFISLITLYLAGRARSGALVMLQEFGTISFSDLMVLFAIGFLSSVICFFLVNSVGKKIMSKISGMNYSKLALICISFILFVNFAFNGFLGIVACAAGAIISKKAVDSKIMKSHCMGVLIMPTLINYLL